MIKKINIIIDEKLHEVSLTCPSCNEKIKLTKEFFEREIKQFGFIECCFCGDRLTN